jgi:hypothetical protein
MAETALPFKLVMSAKGSGMWQDLEEGPILTPEATV